MPTLKPGDWKVMADQAWMRYDNQGTQTNIVPNVDAINPHTGVAGQANAVTIKGQGFTGATGVTLGGTAATALTVVNSQTITCTMPSKAAGPYAVVVTSPVGAGSPRNWGVS